MEPPRVCSRQIPFEGPHRAIHLPLLLPSQMPAPRYVQKPCQQTLVVKSPSNKLARIVHWAHGQIWSLWVMGIRRRDRGNLRAAGRIPYPQWGSYLPCRFLLAWRYWSLAQAFFPVVCSWLLQEAPLYGLVSAALLSTCMLHQWNYYNCD